MTLTAEELNWINKRMNWYGIKYQEIYDEILDHIITGIETARADGDNRIIDIVFQKVVDNHFGGYLGIDKIVTAHEKAYRNKIGKAMLANYRYYINQQSIITLFALLVFGAYLRPTRLTSVILMCGLLVIAVVPVVYVYIKSLKIKTDKGKRSMVKSYILSRSYLLLFFLGSSLNFIRFAAEEWHISTHRFTWPPIIFLVFYFLFIIYGLSITRLSKQEFKISDK